ncbi:NAD(P)-dependent alcohol dehydrogenase [Microbacterium sp. YY-01]|uniref:NAD(P)-dependent alcohol dehydrogenase n=1 Tax=Microbacterium sp. YY-01 TaxID=3421634 RepID=UPI003D177AE2
MAHAIPTTMRANTLVRAGQLEMVQHPVPTPAPDEVLVKVTAVGVCGSDVHFFHEGKLGDWVVNEPLVLGHESGGTIVAVGSQVPESRIGERVSIEPQHPSTTSRETLRGDYHLDPDMQFYAVPGTDGAFQEYVTIQSHFAHSIPDNVSDWGAGLLEPLSVAIATARKAHIGVGDRVLITGSGPIGLASAQVARAAGATEIVMTDISEVRRNNALRFGATAALDPVSDAEHIAGLRADAFIDASGAGAAVRSGLEALRPGGRAILVGMGLPELSLPITTIQNNELVVTGVFRYANTWPAAIALAATGRVDLDSMVTGTFALDQAQQALESTADENTIKSIVEPQR